MWIIISVIVVYLTIGVNIANQFHRMKKMNVRHLQDPNKDVVFVDRRPQNPFMKFIRRNKVLSYIFDVICWIFYFRMKLG